jgi:CRISPR type III-B/RAMP module-associated protein Cmr5
MKNLEQIRAAAALAFFERIKNNDDFKGENKGNVLSKLPSLIVTSGLFSAAAFAIAKEKGFLVCMTDIFKHLAAQEIIREKGSLNAQLRELANADALVLRRATTEAIAYANYLKRFEP